VHADSGAASGTGRHAVEIEPFEPLPGFVAGPLNAGSFGPNPLVGTFGPEVVFQKAAPVANSSPRGASSSSAGCRSTRRAVR